MIFWLCVVAYLLLVVLSAGAFKAFGFTWHWLSGLVFPFSWVMIGATCVLDLMLDHPDRVSRFLGKWTPFGWVWFLLRPLFQFGERLDYKMEGKSPPPAKKQIEGTFRIDSEAPKPGDFCLHSPEEEKLHLQAQAEVDECLRRDPYQELT